jgi:TRAP-type C4-dicarboxylate transport system substrate-binding protein
MLKAVEDMRVRLNKSLDESDRKYMKSMTDEGVKAIVPTETELAGWESDFSKDMAKIQTAVPGAFNMELYTKIKKLVETVRK